MRGVSWLAYMTAEPQALFEGNGDVTSSVEAAVSVDSYRRVSTARYFMISYDYEPLPQRGVKYRP